MNERKTITILDKARIRELERELLMVSKLASDKPMFFNPMNASHAQQIRDRVLKADA